MNHRQTQLSLCWSQARRRIVTLRLPLTVFLMLFSLVAAAVSFTVERIDFLGLKRVDEGVVLRLLDVRVGELFSEEDTPTLIENVYSSGYFEDVKIYRKGDSLLIQVKERPGIVGINIKGNKRIKTEALIEALKRVNISVGEVLDQTALARMREELLQQYGTQGRYGARVEVKTTELPDNKAVVDIFINEGKQAKIKEIHIQGNYTVHEQDILDELQSGKVAWYKFWSGRDNYSQLKLAADLEIIKQIYLDRGYLDFRVKNTQVSLSPNRQGIRVSIVISEGGRYLVSGYELVAEKVVDKPRLREKVELGEGSFFSQKKAVNSSRAIEEELGAAGYAFARVDIIPEKDSETGMVKVIFFINQGAKTYVRRINFYGNSDTDDEVFRQQMRQLEGAQYSARKINLSEARLRRLRFVESLIVEKTLVPNSSDQIDLDFYLKERLSGSFNVSLGYSSNVGAILSFGLKQDNFLGTGKGVSFSFSNAKATRTYGLNIHEPYYTIDGISRNLSLLYRNVNYSGINTAASNSKEYSFGFDFGIPISESHSFTVGGKIQDISVSTNTQSPVEVRDFLRREGNDFLNYALNLGFAYDTRDRAIFARAGGTYRINSNWYLPFSDLRYYKLSFRGRNYQTLGDSEFTLGMRAGISFAKEYGKTAEVPYYDRFYGGGINSVRGYSNNSLGPKDASNRALGGDFRVLGGLDLYLPQKWFGDNQDMRFSTFVDAGNIYADVGDFDSLSSLRTSGGVAMQWLTALGGLGISFAKPLNKKDGDRTEFFQLNLGATF